MMTKAAGSVKTQIMENRAIPYEAFRNVLLLSRRSKPIPTCIADKTTDKNTKGISTHENLRSKKGVWLVSNSCEYPLMRWV
jgi:hypothetical protein